jgi:phospholipid/cholesterol/gamma-HCH transport system substrate-binding protein
VSVANTLPDINADEVLSTLDADTRAYLQILINAGGTALRNDSTATQQGAPADLREALKRFEPTARDGEKFTQLVAKRRTNIKHAIHSFQALSTELGSKDDQLARLVDSANANFQAFAQEESSLRAALRLFPGALSQTATTLTHVNGLASELGPTLQKLRPFARELAPSLRAQRPFLRDTTPIIRDQVRPFARDVQPTVRDLKAATKDLAPVAPRLTRSFKVLNRFFNELAFDPPNGDSFLFWSAWAAHNGALLSTTQDAHGPMIRGIVLLTCNDYGTLESIVRGNPALGMLTRLANFPPERQVCADTNFTAPGEPALDEVPSLVPPEAMTP